MTADSWTCRELSATDLDGVRVLIASAPPHRSMHFHGALADPAAAGRWWFAAIGAGGIGAAAAIQGTRAHLYGDDDSAVRAMAAAMLRSQQLQASREAHRHVLYGPSDVIATFWTTFSAVGRQVVADRLLTLMLGDGDGKGSDKVSLTVATDDDVALCVRFLGEYAAEVLGSDPRKARPRAFEAEVVGAIAEGRLLVGSEGGRAMFVADAVTVDERIAELQRVYVPLAYRSRKLLVGGALFAARSVGPGDGRLIRLFADSEAIELAATRAGFRPVAAWREIAMLG